MDRQTEGWADSDVCQQPGGNLLCMLKIKSASSLSPRPPLELPVSEGCSQGSQQERKHHPPPPHSHPAGRPAAPTPGFDLLCAQCDPGRSTSYGWLSQEAGHLQREASSPWPCSPSPAPQYQDMAQRAQNAQDWRTTHGPDGPTPSNKASWSGITQSSRQCHLLQGAYTKSLFLQKRLLSTPLT